MYKRQLPFGITKKALRAYAQENIPGVFYIHSWELTPEYMPKIKLPTKENFVTFHNINKAFGKMKKILEEFEFTTFSKFMSKHM